MTVGPRTHLLNGRRFRIEALVVAGALAAAIVALIALTGAAFDGGIGCAACHAMRPYVDAAGGSPHGGQSCGSCHASPGALAVIADGARMARMAAGALMGSKPRPSSVSERPCLLCHAEALASVVRSKGIAVRHSDFAATRCAYCHGGVAHAVPGQRYKKAEMDDCLTCHRVGLSNVESCELCHVDEADGRVRDAKTTWRITHGPEWQKTHGLGNLATCSACHRRDACAKCHGVQIPHPDGWKTSHGSGLTGEARARCAGCHEEAWCDACHGGVPMPHPSGFLKTHYEDVELHGYTVCIKCHLLTDCEACHVAGAHLSRPGISPHGRHR